MIHQIAAFMGLRAGKHARVHRLTAREAHEAAMRGSLTLVDVRTPPEWEATGLPSPSTGLTLQREDFMDRLAELAGRDSARPLAFICKAGARSNTAAVMAAKAGYETVFNVTSGMEGPGGWLKERLPLQQGPGQA